MKNNFFYLLILLFTSGCTSEGEQLANKVCSCMMEAGLKEGLSSSNFASSFNQDNDCTDELGRELYEKLKEMNNSQRADFMKDFARELLDTDCAEIAFNLLPYDQMMDEMKKKYKEDYKTVIKYFSNEPSICDCVKMYDEMSTEYRATDDENKMKEVEKKYKEKMDACTKLSEGKTNEEQRQMEKEADACR